jgi:hypothetical protein
MYSPIYSIIISSAANGSNATTPQLWMGDRTNLQGSIFFYLLPETLRRKYLSFFCRTDSWFRFSIPVALAVQKARNNSWARVQCHVKMWTEIVTQESLLRSFFPRDSPRSEIIDILPKVGIQVIRFCFPLFPPDHNN